jgi:very-short-patch-repair endonuclease
MAQPLEAEMAAVLAVPGAVLSHHSAAALHRLLPHPARSGPVHLTIAGHQPGATRAIAIHRTKHLPADEVMRRDRIPVTSPARTILDLAPALGEAALEQLVAEAHRRRLASPQALHTLIARSRAERRFAQALRRAGLDPQANVTVAGYEADLLLPGERVVLEIDGGPFHSSRPDRRRDHERDAALQALGYVVIRVDADDPPERAVALVARASR